MTTINGIELEPCPFCGCEDTEKMIDHLRFARIWCNGCHTSGPSGFTFEAAIELWNKRVTPPSMTVTTSLQEEK